MGRMNDLTGQRFTRLVALHRDGRFVCGKSSWVAWVCRCDCGKTVRVASSALRSGNTRSCGCYCLEVRSAVGRRKLGQPLTHGLSYSAEYRAWSSIVQRCTNPRNPGFKNYGGRGIGVCKRWLDSFENFYDDMGPRPPRLSIDRIDNNADYAPTNCRWATALEQARNRRLTEAVTAASRKNIQIAREAARHARMSRLRETGTI